MFIFFGCVQPGRIVVPVSVRKVNVNIPLALEILPDRQPPLDFVQFNSSPDSSFRLAFGGFPGSKSIELLSIFDTRISKQPHKWHLQTTVRPGKC